MPEGAIARTHNMHQGIAIHHDHRVCVSLKWGARVGSRSRSTQATQGNKHSLGPTIVRVVSSVLCCGINAVAMRSFDIYKWFTP